MNAQQSSSVFSTYSALLNTAVELHKRNHGHYPPHVFASTDVFAHCVEHLVYLRCSIILPAPHLPKCTVLTRETG